MVLQDHAGELTTSDLLNGAVSIPPLEGPGIHLIEADQDLKHEKEVKVIVPNLKRNLLAAATNYDVCVIDSGPHASTLNLAPLLIATHVLAPLGVNKFSMQGVSSLLQSILAAKQQYNQTLDFLGLLPNNFVANQPNQREAMASLMQAVGTEHLFSGYLSQRQAYENVAVTREPVWMENKTAAKAAGKEMRAVLEKIEKRMWKEAA